MIRAAQMTLHLGAARLARTAGPTGDGNGHGPRAPTTRVGASERWVPPAAVELGQPAAGVVSGHEHRADSVLVQACLDGVERAWDTLVERYGPLVYAIPRRAGLPAADADEVFQIVFTTLYRRLHALRDQRRLSSWLIATTQRECRQLGTPAAGESGLGDEPAGDVGAPPADEAIRWEREQQIHQALRSLDDCCRGLLTALFLAPAAKSPEAGRARPTMSTGIAGRASARCFRKLEEALRELGFDAET